MKPASVQHDDRLARAAVAGFGVDAEEGVAIGVEAHRLAVEDRVDDLRLEPVLAVEVLGGREGRRERQGGEPSREEEDGGTAPERAGKGAWRSDCLPRPFDPTAP